MIFRDKDKTITVNPFMLSRIIVEKQGEEYICRIYTADRREPVFEMKGTKDQTDNVLSAVDRRLEVVTDSAVAFNSVISLFENNPQSFLNGFMSGVKGIINKKEKVQ